MKRLIATLLSGALMFGAPLALASPAKAYGALNASRCAGMYEVGGGVWGLENQ